MKRKETTTTTTTKWGRWQRKCTHCRWLHPGRWTDHIFWADASKPSVLYTKETDEAPVITLPFHNDKFVQQQNRLRELKEFALKSIPAPGIKPIKQVELYTKWRKFVPDSFQDEICPKPSTDVINQVTSDRKQKNRERTSKKRPRVRGGRGAS